ncbi:hypothetical protein OPT61_g2568 [Boeremia exigua]|uniref:Uncharacterized protein n=1 Tax=Boeremia exigua TaxID=749465 RepID=A0ACC2IL19_9PLEO|nr:hypothetical protein OPT61_g2568 [Boeremia exigua]
MPPKTQPAPSPFAPSSAHVALAIALIRTKPPGLSARGGVPLTSEDHVVDHLDYIVQLREQVRPGSAPSEHREQGGYIDLVAYWKEQCRTLQDECSHLRNENSRLERSNHSLAHHTGLVPDGATANAMNTSKRKARVGSPARNVKRQKGEQPVERSVAETQEEIDNDMDFLDGLGQEGADLTESLFTTHKLCRSTDPDFETLCFTLVRTSDALGKVIRLVAHRHGQLSRQGHQTSGPASLDQDKSNFAVAMTICARGFMSILVGLTRLKDSTDDQRFSNLVVCKLTDMFKTVLVAIESVARQTAQQNLIQAVEPKKPKEATPAKVLKESVPARALAHLLVGLLGFLEKTNSVHQQIFDGFVYLLLERVGQRLFFCTFGRHRSRTVEGDVQPLPEPKSPEEAHRREVETFGTHLEVKALILVLERAMGLAPNHMNPQASNVGRNQKKVGRTLSLKNLPAASKARLSPVAKERLQQTLIVCMYGDKADDEFLDVLTKPMPSMRLGSLQNVGKIEDKDVKDWYKKEVWRLVGWDVLAKESGHLSTSQRVQERRPDAAMATKTSTTTAKSSSKDSRSPRYSISSHSNNASANTTSPGVARVRAAAEHLTTANRACIIFGVLLVSWAYGLDNTLRTAYHAGAMNALHAQALLATVSVVKAVIGAAAQPTAAKISDVFGRVEILFVSVVFYVLGSAIEAFANNPATFVVGSFFHQIGFTMSVLILEVIIADTTSLRARLLFSYMPAVPFLVNAWLAGEVLEKMLKIRSWRFGFWIWCIIYPICAIPLLVSLWWVDRKAKKAGTLKNYKTPVQQHGAWEITKALFWQLDVIGILLTICVFGFLLVPLTLNGGMYPTWGEAKFIVPLVIGVLCVPLWVFWESIAPHPMVPFYLLKDRAVWGSLCIGLFLMFSWACQGDFLFIVLRVGFNQSDKAANRITALYGFCSTLTGIFVGMVVYHVRHLKPFILFGTCLFMVAMGLMIHYRGGVGTHSGIIGAQVLLGVAGGFFPYAAQASIQAATSHEYVAVVTGLYLSTYNVGSAVGNAVSGVVMSRAMPEQLHARLGWDDVTMWYALPLQMLDTYPPGTPEREAVIEAYKYFQRVVCIIAACGCLGLIAFAFCIRNPRLPDTQTLPHKELPPNEHNEDDKHELAEWPQDESTFPGYASTDRR